MPPSPNSVVERFVAAMNAHDAAGARDLLAPGARMVTATGRVLGPGGLGRLFADALAAFPDLQIEVTRWVAQDDLVVTEEVMSGTHAGDFAGLPATGRRVRLAMCHVTRVLDGRIVERVAYHDTAAVLRQLTAAAAAG